MYQYNLNEGYTYQVEYYSEMGGRSFDSAMHTATPMPGAFALFADAVRDDTPFLVQPEEGVIVMRILDAIYRSAETGEPVKLA
jgi:predicted dehydrogenase